MEKWFSRLTSVLPVIIRDRTSVLMLKEKTLWDPVSMRRVSRLKYFQAVDEKRSTHIEEVFVNTFGAKRLAPSSPSSLLYFRLRRFDR